LGKGLEALIPKSPAETKVSDLSEIEITAIKPTLQQARKSFDEAKLEELAASIKEKGIIQPLVVRKIGSGYEIVAGERRYRAAMKAGLSKVPAVVLENVSEQELLELSLIENLQREDLNPIEEALGYRTLMGQFNLTQEQISQRIGKDRSVIANKMRLLNLAPSVKIFLADDKINEGHARVLLSVPDEKIQIELAGKIVNLGLSVRQLEDLLTRKPKTKITFKKGKEISPQIERVEKALREFFATKVRIVQTRNKRRIEVSFYNDEDLNRILELLKIYV